MGVWDMKRDVVQEAFPMLVGKFSYACLETKVYKSWTRGPQNKIDCHETNKKNVHPFNFLLLTIVRIPSVPSHKMEAPSIGFVVLCQPKNNNSNSGQSTLNK